MAKGSRFLRPEQSRARFPAFVPRNRPITIDRIQRENRRPKPIVVFDHERGGIRDALLQFLNIRAAIVRERFRRSRPFATRPCNFQQLAIEVGLPRIPADETLHRRNARLTATPPFAKALQHFQRVKAVRIQRVIRNANRFGELCAEFHVRGRTPPCHRNG